MADAAELFRRCRATLGLSAEGLARALWIGSGRTVRKWEAGDRAIPPLAWRCLYLIMHERGDAALAGEILRVMDQREAA
jgi:DNA-binding transcriptional regulator YiaG